MSPEEYRKIVANNLEEIQIRINEILRGQRLSEIEPVLARIDVSHTVPDWFIMLQNGKGIATKDGKTIGSILEKLLVCVLEIYIFKSSIQLSVNPARGVDIPELELGVKSPSTNFCTSEPYFSAYERLLGNEYDAIILLTDFQNTKGKSKLDLQIMDIKYLRGSEIADKNLCSIAKSIRDNCGLDDYSIKKLIRFLAYINQSDWEASRILEIIEDVIINNQPIRVCLEKVKAKFLAYNKIKAKENKLQLDEEILRKFDKITTMSPVDQAIIRVAEDWVIENQSDNGRFPNENEWRRFCSSPLDGKITMSFALQWRYNFGSIFKISKEQHKTSLLDL